MNSELIKKYYDAAPEDVQAVVKDVINKPETISSIAQKNGIAPDDVASLQIEILLILLGLEFVSSFRTNLMKRLGTSYNQALKITSDVNSNFLNPILDTLKNFEQGAQEEPDQIVLEKDTEAIETVKALVGEKPETRENTTSQDVPAKLIPDHEVMEKIDGPHVHTQTVMPTPESARPEPAKPTVGSGSFGSLIPSVKKTFGSIVDQKLSRIVTSNEQVAPINSVTPTAEQKPIAPKNVYNGKDPYREPLE